MTHAKINKKKTFLVVAFIGLFIILSFPIPTLASFEISDGTVKGLYHLEDVADSSGNARNLSNAGTTAFVVGKFNNSADFANNNSKYLYRAESSVLGLTGNQSFSVSWWYNLASETTGDDDQWDLFFKSATGSGNRCLYEYNGGTRRMRCYRSGSSNTFLDITGNLGSGWHHYVYTYDGSTVKLWKDAVLSAYGNNSGTYNSSGAAQSEGFDIGDTRLGNYSAGTNGLIDELVVINGAISTSTIESLYNSGTGNEVCVTQYCASSPPSTPTTTSACPMDFTGGNRIDRIYYSEVSSTTASGTVQKIGEYRSPLIYFLFLLLTTGASLMIIGYYVYVKKNSNIKLYGNRPRR